MRGTVKEVLLTFDVEGPPRREDFIEPEIIRVLYKLLTLLKKHDLRALFFVTGSIAENLVRYPRILELLETHEIGYHSSSHSVRPRIFEYTDVENYGEAVEASIRRESSSIDLLTGDIIGTGGVFLLRKIFPDKQIDSFRAPFLCWSPPHLEALRKMGFRFDFSADVCNVPSFFKGITFMPYPMPIDSMFHNLDVLLKRALQEKSVIFLAHPSHMIFEPENSSQQRKNPFDPVQIKRRSPIATQTEFLELDIFLSGLRRLQKRGIIKMDSSSRKPEETLDLEKVSIPKAYAASLRAPKKIFGYRPEFLLSHFYRFFKT